MDQNGAGMEAILTDVSPARLECTLHSPRHRCLLRLWSRRLAAESDGAAAAASASTSASSRGGGADGKKSAAALAAPDLSTLCAVPIGGAGNGRDGSKENGIWLMPKLFRAAHPTPNSMSDDEGNAASSLPKDHPVHELVKITGDMEGQLKERLGDASDGAMRDDKNKEVDPSTWFGAQEAFLRRSEAILQELLSAVGQQLRRGEANRSGQNRKRKAAERGASGSALAPPPLTYYSALVHQLQTIQSLPNVTDISLSKDTAADGSSQDGPSDLTRVSVTCLDEKKRSHTWHAEIYPDIVLTVDLPSEFVLDDKIRLERWWEDGGDSNQAATLPRIHAQFEEALTKYQPIFDELDDLDAHLWILEPSLPARRDSVERRIALWEGGASMAIVLDPENARGVPVMVRFLGVTMATMTAAANATNESGRSAGEVVDWRKSFATFVSEEDEGKPGERSSKEAPAIEQSNQKRWSEDRSVRENLELWFGAPLPSPLSESTEKSDFLVECGICYMHRLPTEDESEEGPLPEAKCGNPSCNRAYHETCLFEWLHSLPTARVSFDRIFGSCPYCCEAVSVKIMNAGSG